VVDERGSTLKRCYSLAWRRRALLLLPLLKSSLRNWLRPIAIPAGRNVLAALSLGFIAATLVEQNKQQPYR
jgi:hypothetical protein